ncbi:hypothetical protein NDU88_001817 [Pleurodeles waltl]|uniref:Kringle domain-containing protein n=1 Tax=Pleurodeles waltl TaxID=8319 RepID=A0AAV7W0L2_PLEWA|nr:hypothetical protein NDU88_001817 [Pleurodeles waltl]
MTIPSFIVALVLGAIPGGGCFDKSAGAPAHQRPSSQRLHPHPHRPLPPSTPYTGCTKGKGQGNSVGDFVNVTDFGAQCLNWLDVPTFLERTPGKGLGDHNFCRNPDGRSKPWCFYRNNRGRVDWGYCDCKQGEYRKAWRDSQECWDLERLQWGYVPTCNVWW